MFRLLELVWVVGRKEAEEGPGQRGTGGTSGVSVRGVPLAINMSAVAPF